MISENYLSLDVLRDAFDKCTALPPPKTQIAKKITYAGIYMVKAPWKLTNLVVVSLEKIGDGARATPNFVLRQKQEKWNKRVEPSNLATGVAFGTKLMVEHLVSAITGVVLEPVRGAKKGGLKGGALGFGKGILGLVCKPVAGTIDFVTHTTRGLGNTPMTVYIGINSLIRKRRIRRRNFKRNVKYPAIRPYIPT